MDTNTIIIYLLVIFVIIQTKPQFLFKQNGDLKRFGVSKKD